MRLFYLSAFILWSESLFPQKFRTGEDLLLAMHKKYYKAPCECYTFSQRNTHYKGDTVSGNSEWHEAVQFPDKFRIIFGNRADSNYILFRNDSLYSYRKAKLVKAKADTNQLLLLLGGMYYRNMPDVLARFKASGYDTRVISEQTWKGAGVFVIGAGAGDLKSNQVWIEKKQLLVVRIVEKMNETDIMDMRFDSHQPSCRGFTESKVSFFRNDVLEQEEEYYEIREDCGF